MGHCFIHGGEHTSRLHNTFGTRIRSFNVGGVLSLEDGDDLPADVSFIGLDCSMELLVSGIRLEYIDHIVRSVHR